MKIGHLHSWIQKDLWIPFNAILIRHQWETWDYARKNNLNYWKLKYGKGSSREKLRDLIYNHTNLGFLSLARYYNLIFLSVNFDIYPSSENFRVFVKDVVSTYKLHYPNKTIIVGAGNETMEKRGLVKKVIQTTVDTNEGIKKANANYNICCWNQKIYTTKEKEAFTTLLSNELIGQICKYVGFQSLGTKACDLATYIRYIKNMGYEPVDVELGHQSDKLASSEKLFKIDKDNGVEKVFLLCPKITKKCADFNKLLSNCAFSIDEYYKDKYKLIKEIQQYKDKEEVINEMWDDIIFNRLYKLNSKGIGVLRIQRIFNLWVESKATPHLIWAKPLLETNSLFDNNTKEAIILFQRMNNLLVDGKAGKQTMTELLKFLLDRVKYYE